MKKETNKYRIKYFIRDDPSSNRRLIVSSWAGISTFEDAIAWIYKRLQCGALIDELTIDFK